MDILRPPTASVIRVYNNGGVLVWYDGRPQDGCLTLEPEAFKLLWNSYGGGTDLPPKAVLLNIQLYLSSLIRDYDFKVNGPIVLTEARTKELLKLK